jgi:hypothetical protein
MKTSITILLTTLVAAGSLLAAAAFRADEAPPITEPEAATTDAAKPDKPKVKPYPLETCIVSDEKLGSMGKPVVFEYQGQEIKLCCKGCRKDFDKGPAKFLKKLEQKK